MRHLRHTMHVAYSRDPVSVLFDAGARRLLERAYARPGHWAGTVLADPGPRHRSWAANRGIDLMAADRIGDGRARTRWARGFTRALYYQHKWYSGREGFRGQRRRTYRTSGGLVVEVGRVKPAVGVIPRGRAVRVMLVVGGKAKKAAVAELPPAQQWAEQGPAWADPAARDWA